MANSDFPRFSDGNVEIYFSENDEKYVLHSHVLALHSSWFKVSLSKHWNAGNEATLINGKNHWSYELRFDKDQPLGMLARKGNSPPETEFISGAEDDVSADTLEAQYAAADKTLFRARTITALKDTLAVLYHLSPAFVHDTFPNSLESIMLLAKTAEMYGCQSVVRLPIEKYLLENRNQVLDVCAKEPVPMCELALILNSKWIFIESSVYIIGSSNVTYTTNQPGLAKIGLNRLFEHKRAQLVEKLRACELRLFLLQPREQANSDGDAPLSPVAIPGVIQPERLKPYPGLR